MNATYPATPEARETLTATHDARCEAHGRFLRACFPCRTGQDPSAPVTEIGEAERPPRLALADYRLSGLVPAGDDVGKRRYSKVHLVTAVPPFVLACSGQEALASPHPTTEPKRSDLGADLCSRCRLVVEPKTPKVKKGAEDPADFFAGRDYET